MKRLLTVLLTIMLCLGLISCQKDSGMKSNYQDTRDFITNLNWELTPKDLEEVGFEKSDEVFDNQATQSFDGYIIVDSFSDQVGTCTYNFANDKLISLMWCPPIADTYKESLPYAEIAIKEMDSSCNFTKHNTTDQKYQENAKSILSSQKRLDNRIDPMKCPTEYITQNMEGGVYQRFYDPQNDEFKSAVLIYRGPTKKIPRAGIQIIISNIDYLGSTMDLSQEE